jgi:hypothetical protein
MTTRTRTTGQEKRGFRGVVAMTAATAALLGGVLLFQLRPSGEATAPTTASHAQVSDGVIQRSDAELHSGVPSSAGTTTSTFGWAELYAELQAGAATASVVPVAVDTMGGMAELTHDQHARATSVQERSTVYVVRSTEDAIAFREFLASIRSASGLPPIAVNMLVSDLDTAALAQGMPQAPDTTYIDLRPVRTA